MCFGAILTVVGLTLLPAECLATLQNATLKATWDFRGASSKASVMAQVSSNPYAALFNPNANQLQPKDSSTPKVSHLPK